MNIERMRKEFESFASQHSSLKQYTFDKYPADGDQYDAIPLQGAWCSWQAACAVLAQEAGKCEPVAWTCGESVRHPSQMSQFDRDGGSWEPAFAAPPAPVSVVLPSPAELRALVTEAARDSDLIAGSNYYTAAELAANYLLGKVKELNQ